MNQEIIPGDVIRTPVVHLLINFFSHSVWCWELRKHCCLPVYKKSELWVIECDLGPEHVQRGM